MKTKAMVTGGILLAVVVGLFGGRAEGATYTWNISVAGPTAWNANSSWLPATGFPNAIDDIANVNNDISANVQISMPAVITIGTLNIGDASGANTFTINNGSALTFDVSAGNAALTRTATGAVVDTISTPVTLNDPLTVTINSTSGSLTIGGAIGGANALTKAGAGTLTLSAANTFSGTTTISAGTLSLGIATALQNSVLDTSASIAGDAANGLKTTVTTLTLGGLSGNKDFAAAGGVFTTTSGGYGSVTALTLNPGTGISTTYSGAIANGAATTTLTKSGAGTQILQGASGYSGLTTVSAGALNIQNATALGTTAAGASVTSGAALQIQGGITIGTEALTLNGTGINVTGALRNISGGNNYGGLVTLGSATRINSDADTLTLSNADTITGATFGLTVGGAGNTTINSIIGTTSGTVTKDGAGTLTLTAANTYTGATTIYAGTLALSGAGTALSSAFSVYGGTLTLDNSAALADRLANGTAITLGSLTLKSKVGSGTQSETVGATTFATSGKITVDLNGGTDQTTLALNTVTRSVGAAIDFVGTGGTLGSGANSPNVTSSGAFPGTSNSILPWGTVNGTSWAQDNANSIRAATGITYYDPTSTASDSTKNAQLNGVAGVSSLSAAKAFNSLNVITSGSGQSLNLASGANLNLTSGALLKSGADAYTISSGGGILGAGATGTGTELIAHVDGGDLTISAPLNTAIVGLAKGGTGKLILSGTRAGTFSGNISIAGALELQGNSTTLSTGVISGPGALIANLTAGQTLTVSGANSFSGQLSIPNGTLASTTINNVCANGTLGNSALNVILGASGQTGRLKISQDGGPSSDKAFTLATGGTGEIWFDDANSGVTGWRPLRSLTLSGAISGSGNLVKTGNATLVLTGNNDYSGTTTLSYGVLRLGSANALPGGIGVSGGVNNLVIDYGVLELGAANFYRNVGTGASQFQITGGYSGFSAINGARIVSVNNDPNLELVWGSSTFNPSTLVLNENQANNTLTLQNKMDLGGATRTIAAQANTATIANDIRTSSGTAIGITKTGAGELALSGNNTYDGPTTISAGTLTISSAGAVNGTSQIVLSGTSTLNVNFPNQSLTKLVAGGGVPFGTFLRYSQAQTAAGAANGPGTIRGTVEINLTNVNPDYTLDFGNYSTFKNVIAATYTSPITLSGDASIDSSTAVFTLNTGGITVSSSGTKTLTLTGSVANNIISSVIGNGSGTMSVTKSGAGSWSLTGANTYSGATTVSAGTLTLSGANGAIGSSAVTIAGGTLTLSNANAANNGDRLSGALTMNGGTFNFNNDASVGNSFSESVGALTLIGGANTVGITQAIAGQTSTLTFAGLSRTAGAINFSGTGLGTTVDTRGRITFTTPPPLTGGIIIGPWATVNGTAYATLDGGNNVVAYSGGAIVDVTRLSSGSKVIPNTSTADVRIREGTTAPNNNLTLAGDPTTTINSLLQSTLDATANQATVDIASGKTLLVNWVTAVPSAPALTLGTAANTGTLTPATGGGDLLLVNSSANTLTVNSVIANNGSASTVTKDGSGLLKLTANNTYSGGTFINAGTVWVTTDLNLGVAGSGITFNGPAALSCGNNVSSTTVNLGTRPIAINNGALVGLYYNYADTTITVGGAVTGTGGLNWGRDPVVAYGGGGGSVFLNLNSTGNNFTGPITVGMGTENAQGGGSQFNFSSLADSANSITFNFGGALAFRYNAVGPTANLSLANRPINLLNSNATIQNLNATYTLTLGAVSTTTAGGKTLNLGAGGAGGIVAGAISNGNGTISVTKSGGGTWALSGINTYSGTTTLSDSAGTVTFQNASQSLSASSAVSIGKGSTIKLLVDTTGTVTLGNNLTATGTGTGERFYQYIFVGNNNTLNGGTSGGTTTGSTLVLGNVSLTGGDTRCSYTLNVLGANSYRLQLGGLTLANRADFGAQQISPTTAPVTITGTVTQASGNPGSSTAGNTLELTGTATGNLVSGTIQDAADYPTNPNARALNLTKSSTSDWTLSGTSTYTGTTTVNGGLLRVTGALNGSGAVNVTAGSLGGTGSINGAVTVSGTGGIDLRDSAVGNLTLNNGLAITGAAGANNLYFDLGNGTSVPDKIVVTGAVTVNTIGAAVITLNQLSGTKLDAGTYDLITATGTMDLITKFTLATTAAAGNTFSLQIDPGTGKKLQLVVTPAGAGPASTVWTGASSVNWSAGGNWTGGSVPGYATDATFYNTAANLTTTVDADFDINSLNFNAGAISAVTVGGTKTLTLEGVGGTGITLSTPNSGTPTHTISAKVALGSSQTWTVNSGGLLTVSGVVSDFGAVRSITKAGAGTLTLTGLNTYSGPTIISGGTLVVNYVANTTAANPLGMSSAAAANLLLNPGATLKFLHNADVRYTTDRGFTINGTAPGDSATLDSSIFTSGRGIWFTGTACPAYGTPNQTRTLILTGTHTSTATLDNQIDASIADNGSGAVSLVKNGLGTWYLTGANTFTGGVTINAGTLRLGSTSALGTGTLTINGGALDNGSGGAIVNSRNNVQSWNGDFGFTGTQSLNLGTGAVTLGGTRTVTVSGANALTVGGVIGGASGYGLTKAGAGAGALQLTANNTYNGATTVSAGTLTLSGANGAIGNSAVTIAGGTLTVTNAASAININRLSDSEAFTMNGGTLNFNNDASANDFSESVGMLTLVGGANTVGIQTAAVGRASTLIFAGLSRTAGAINFSGPGLGTTVDTRGKITFTSPPTLTGGIIGTWATVNGTSYATLDANSNVVAYVGSTDVYRGAGVTKAIPDTGADVRFVEGTTSASDITLAGTTTTTINSLLQSISGGSTFAATVDIASGKTLLVDTVNAVATAPVLTLGKTANTGTLMPKTGSGNLLLVNSGGAMTINSVIANNGGASSITKDGSGALTLAANNTFTGSVTINAGSLTLSGNNSSGYSGGTIINSGTVNITADNNLGNSAGGVTFSGTGMLAIPANPAAAITFSRSITVNSGVVATMGAPANYNSGFTHILNGNLTGSGTFIYAAPNDNRLRLDGAGGFTGTFWIQGMQGVRDGVVVNNVNVIADAAAPIKIGVPGAASTAAGYASLFQLGTGAGGPLTFNSRWIVMGNHMLLGNENTTAGRTLTFTQPFVVTATTASTLYLGGASGNGVNVLSGGGITDGPNGAVISMGVNNSGYFTQTSIWAVSGANTYSGATTVSAGVLNIQNATALGTVAAGTTVASGAALQLQGNITVGAEALTLSGTGISTTGALRNMSGDNVFGGLLTLGAATRINSDAGTLTLSNTGTITGATFGLTVGGAGNTTIAGNIGTTTGTLTKDGTGTLTLSGANTYSGITTISASGGTLQFARQVSLYNNVQGSWTKANIIVNNGGTLALNVGGTGEFTTSDVTFLLGSLTGAINNNGLRSGSAIAFDTSNASPTTFTVADIIADSTSTGGGAIGVKKFGANTLELTGNSTYTGVTTVTGGTLSISSIDTVANANPLGKSSAVAANLLLGNGTTLKYTGGTASCDRGFTINGTTAGDSATLDASGTGALSLTATGSPAYGTVDQTRTLILGGTSTDNNLLAANIADNGAGAVSVTKTGVGTWVLSGACTYTGGTTISGGTLSLGANNRLHDATAVSIGSATLNAVTYQDSVGTLDVTGSAVINLGSGAALAFADSSAVDWTGGTLNITGTFVSGTSLRFGTDGNGLTGDQIALISMSGWKNFVLDSSGNLTADEAIPPTLAGSDIVDNKGGATVPINTLVTYTVTFNEDMDASTVSDTDFGNAGDAPVTIGAVTETLSGVFSVPVTPTGSGTLRLKVNAGAMLKDAAANALDTTSAILDNTTLTVETSDSTPPLLSGIADNKGGGPIMPSTLVTYTVTFNEDMDAGTVSSADFSSAGTATYTIGGVSETAAGVFTVEVTPTSAGTLQLQINASAELKDVAGNALDTGSALPDETTLVVDGTAPTLTGFVDDKSGGPVMKDTLVTYTVTFNEDMDAGTVSDADFGNAGTATYTIGGVSETVAGVFTVEVTPTSAGTLQLQINASAELKDPAGNLLNTASAILDETTLTVDDTLPTLAGSDIVDDKSGGPVAMNTLVTYTVSFSEDMDASTVSDTDFGNAGTASFTIGAVTETSENSGVFTVPVTPTSSGTLQLKVNASAELKDAAGNALNTASAILDDTTLIVIGPTLTWDANGLTAGQTDGAGAWLNPNLWWNGTANQNWVSIGNAIFGNSLAGGAVTLASPTMVNSLTFNSFSGTYTLGTIGQTITLYAGITKNASGAGALTIISPVTLGAAQTWLNNSAGLLTVGTDAVGNGGFLLTVDGSGSTTVSSVIGGLGGLAKSGVGVLDLTAATGNTYGGVTTVNGGVLRLSNATALPGGIGVSGGTSALTINGGVVELANGDYLRDLGAGVTQGQITGGTSGFSARSGARIVNFNNDAHQIIWGDATFAPGALVLNETTANNTLDFKNAIDLGGSARTVAVNANSATLSGALTGSGGSLTKTGAGTLVLSNAGNSYGGGTTVNAGTLSITSDGNLGAVGSTITFNGNAQVNNGGASDTTINFGSRPITLNSGAIATFNALRGQNYQTTGAVTGTGGVSIGASGGNTHTLSLLSTANTFTGPITFNSGDATIIAVNSLSDSSETVTIQSGSTFRYASGAVENLTLNNRPFVLNGSAAIDNSSAYALTINTSLSVSGSGSKTLTVQGSGGGRIAADINQGSSTLGITKTGGTWSLSGNNTYSGQTTINDGAGTLVFQNASASLSAASTVLIGGSAGMTLLDDGAGTVNLGNNVNLSVQGTGERDGPTFFVGNNNTANGGTSSGTTTGSTIALGIIDLVAGGSDSRSTQTINVTGANGYRLQMGGLIIGKRADFGPPQINATTAPVTIAGTVTQKSGKLVTDSTAGDQLQLIGTATGNLISGVIQDAADYTDLSNPNAKPFNLLKSGTGDWTLSGTSTYTGTTTVNQGLLRVTGALNGNGAVGVSAGFLGGTGSIGGAVTLTGTGGIELRDEGVGTLTLGSLAVNGAAGANNLYFDLGAGAAGVDTIAVTGAVTMTNPGAGVVTLNPLGGADLGTYDLITGSSVPAAANFTLATSSGFGRSYSLTGTGTKLQLVVGPGDPGPAAPVWYGGGNNWSTGGNWTGGAVPGYESNVSFYNRVNNITTDVLDSDFDINSLTFTVDATSAVTIGGTKLLAIEALTANGNTAGSGITVNTPSSGTPTHTISAKVGMVASQTWTVNSGAALTVSGVVSDFGAGNSLTKAGAGTLTLSGANTYAGATIIQAGTLTVSSVGNSTAANPLGMSSAAANLVLNPGTTLKFVHNADVRYATDRGFTINGTAPGDSATLDSSIFTNVRGIWFTGTACPAYGTPNQTRTLILTGTQASNRTLDNQIDAYIADNGAGSVSLVKNGVGTWKLAGANTFTGGLSVQNGILRLGSATSAGAGVVTIGSTGNNATLDLDGGSRTIIGLATAGTAANQIITSTAAGGVLNYTGATTSIFGGVITGSTTSFTAVTVNNVGADFTLGGVNTYTGATTVNAGILRITGSTAAGSAVGVSGGALGGNGIVNGTVTLTGAGGIDLQDGAVGILTVNNNLAINGAAGANNLSFDLGTAGNGTDKITVSGNVTMTTSGAAVINLTQLSGTKIDPGTYDLIVATGTMESVDKFTLATTAAAGNVFSLQLDPGTSKKLQLVVAEAPSAPAAAFWKGSTDNNWSTGANWDTDATGGTQASGAPGYITDVSFYATGAGRLTTGTLDADFDINSLTYIADATANTVIGGSPNSLILEAGSGITVNTPSSGMPTNTISADVGIAISQTWTVESGAALNVSGRIGDLGAGNSLTKSGAGTLTLTGASTYSGATIVNGGTVVINSVANGGAASTLGQSGSSAANLRLGNGTTLRYNSGGTLYPSNRGFTIDGTAPGDSVTLESAWVDAGSLRGISFTSTASPSYGVANQTRTLILGGSFAASGVHAEYYNRLSAGIADNGSGAVSVIKTGTGSWGLLGSSTFTGGLSVQQGTLKLGAITAAGAGLVTIGTPGNSATLDLGGGQRTILSLATAGTAANQTITSTAPGGILNYAGAATSTFGGVITGSTASYTALRVDNAGASLTLSGANTYSGATTINAGTLVLGNASALGTGTLIISGVSTLDSAVVNLVNSRNNTQNWNDSFTFAGSQNLDLGTGPVTLNTTPTVTVSANTLTVGGAISGSGYGLIKAGTGTLKLTGANAYTGPTTVNAGTLLVEGSLAAAGTTVITGGTLGGTGTVGIVTNNATLAPGHGAVMGTLSASSLVLNAGCTNAFDLGVVNASDTVAVSGALGLNGGVITVAEQAGFDGGTYTLFSYGTSSGVTLPTISTPLIGYSVVVTNNETDHKVQLIVNVIKGSVYKIR